MSGHSKLTGTQYSHGLAGANHQPKMSGKFSVLGMSVSGCEKTEKQALQRRKNF
jgi:hypothetical protein